MFVSCPSEGEPELFCVLMFPCVVSLFPDSTLEAKVTPYSHFATFLKLLKTSHPPLSLSSLLGSFLLFLHGISFRNFILTAGHGDSGQAAERQKKGNILKMQNWKVMVETESANHELSLPAQPWHG